MIGLLKYPSAWIPLALTVLTLGVFGLYFAGIIPPDPTGDEGTAAHLFQIWLVLEAIGIAFFFFKEVASKPREALPILGLQIASAFVPLAIVYSLHL